MATGIEKFQTASPTLDVPQSAIIRAVRRLDHIEAIALIRAAYREGNGAYMSLEDAKLIYYSIGELFGEI